MYWDLHRPITLYDYWNDALSDRDRESVDQASRARARADGFRTDQPLCRIDYLRQHYIFLGLVPFPDGTFEIKTTTSFVE